MIQTILGAVLYCAPFILIFTFQDKLRGLLRISAFMICAHLAATVITQAFHIFSYGVVLGIHAIIAVVCVAIFIRREKYFSGIKFSWLVLLVAIVVGFELSSVHYFYKGIVSDIGGLNAVSRDFYPYPHYSDEWVGVSLVNYSINEGSLPLVNSLWKNEPYPNGLAFFHSIVSEFFLLLNISPLMGWSLFAVVNGLMISFLIFLILKSNGISDFSSAAAALSVPLIVNGVNLSGIWFFVPHIFAFSIFLLSLVSFSKKEFKAGIIQSLVCIGFYPPIIVFVAPTLLAYIFSNKVSKYYALLICLAAAVITLLLSLVLGFSNALSLAVSWIVRPNLDGGIISMSPWVVIPVLLLPFAAYGIYELYKKKLYTVLVPVLIGIFFWILYSFIQDVFIIDKSRVVAMGAILLMIPAGFGIEALLRCLRTSKQLPHNLKIALFFEFAVVTVFLVSAFFYPVSNSWSKFVLNVRTEEGTIEYISAAPITRYLSQDDMKLFEGISGKVFLSHPWKGLVIGAATGNYPLDSKSSTLTNRFVRYYDFMKGSCQVKTALAKDFSVDYVYGAPFECDGFEKLGQSKENQHLYKFVF